MRHMRLLAALVLASPITAAAQIVRTLPEPPISQATRRPTDDAVTIEKPEPSCVCSRYNYKPLNAKGTAAKEYWDARGKAKVSRSVSGITLLFGYLAQSGNAVNAAQDTYGKAMEELSSARHHAESVGAVKVVGDDFEEESIEFLLKKGVDYELTNP